MEKSDEILEQLEQFVQEMRENGDTDLRTILWVIRKFKEDPDYKLIEKE